MTSTETRAVEYVEPEQGEKHIRVDTGLFVLRIYTNDRRQEDDKRPTHRMFLETKGGLQKVTGLWARKSPKNNRWFLPIKFGFVTVFLYMWREAGELKFDHFAAVAKKDE